MKYLAVFLAFLFGLIAIIYISFYFGMLWGLLSPIEIPIVLEGTREYFEIKWQLIGQDIGSILFIIVCIIFFTFFYSLYRRMDKRKKDLFDKDSIKGPFVLYLRSFIDDKMTNKRISFVNDVRTEEEVLVEVLSDIAPVYAIGDPSDKKMPLGASRIYVEDEFWKSTVTDMMNKAVVVVLRLGKTESFWWEVETVVKNISLEKVMFVVPENNTFSNVTTLYKILLDHNIDFKHLDVKVEKKNQGSISSFLYFDKKGEFVASEVTTPSLTNLVLSYENILRNALTGFREKFGLNTDKKLTIRYARILQIVLLLSVLFIGCGKLFDDLTTLKYQMPYEFVENCIESPEFVNKYSDEINDSNLIWGIVESRKGVFGLNDLNFILLFQIEAITIHSMRHDEYNQIQAAPQNMLLMVKKYFPESYSKYVELLSEAAIISIQHPNELKELILQYKQNINAMPQWIYDFVNFESMSENEYEYVLKFNSKIMEHIDDVDIADVLKTFFSLFVNEN